MATNVDGPFGFYPVGHLLNGQYDGRYRWYNVAAAYGTALFRGDAVKSSGTGHADGKYGQVEAAAATNTMRGVLVQIQVDRATAATEHPGYLPASTGGYVGVIDDPFVIFAAQEDSDSSSLAITEIANTCDHVAGAGSTTTGLSGHELNSDSSDAGFKLLALENREGAELGATSSNAVWLCVINEHELNSAVAGV